MRLLLLSPYHSGSHRAWATGYQTYSAHDVALLTLPGRFWKWRMHGGAVTLARQFLARAEPLPDVIMTDDMLDVTTFLALTRPQTATIPIVLYMHENQLTYPLPADKTSGPMRRQHGERDRHYVFINYASMLAADRVFFNSAYHLDSWFDALPGFLNHFPEQKELHTVDALRAKASVLPVGVNFDRLKLADDEALPAENAAPLILWNQRWEYDKNPQAFFDALYALAEAGIAFDVALCGERFSKRPAIFEQAAERLGARIVHQGYADLATYRRLLHHADVVVSTANHEFFGISILEAIYCRTLPVLPRRLSYPELLPAEFHDACLYDDRDGLLARLRWALTETRARRTLATELAERSARFDWRTIAPRYDQMLVKVAESD